MAKRNNNEEDRRLWRKVTETVTPLGGGKTVPSKNAKTGGVGKHKAKGNGKISELHRTMPDLAKTAHPAGHSMAPLQPLHRLPVHHSFDHKTRKKIAKGRTAIDARIDLHGMTQEQAIVALRRFIMMAQASGKRLLLVVTGKGEAGQGVLRRSVPDWLLTGELASMVSGVEEAHRGHGGSGALYVRLRRRNQP